MSPPCGRLLCRGDGRLAGDVGVLEAKLRVTDLDDVAVVELLLRRALAVDKRAAGTVRVEQQHVVALDLHLAVDAGHVAVSQARLRGLAAADEQRVTGGERERAALVGAGDDKELLGHARTSSE